MTAFLEVVHEFERSESGVEKMEVLISEMGKKTDPYSVPYMKQQLRIHFNDAVDFSGYLLFIRVCLLLVPQSYPKLNKVSYALNLKRYY